MQGAAALFCCVKHLYKLSQLRVLSRLIACRVLSCAVLCCGLCCGFFETSIF
nr:MAG TPA: hypothetical protein [Bacteriophage sp.]